MRTYTMREVAAARSGLPLLHRVRAAGPTKGEAVPRVRKDDARCCIARRDELGRLPIGYCSPECERRPARGG